MRTLKISLLVFILSITISAQWEWVYLGFQGIYIYDIAIDDSGNIYASANGVYKSTDNGATWQLKMNIGVRQFEIDNNGFIYMAGFVGIFKSTDGGNTFFQIGQSIPSNEFYDISYINNGIFLVSSFNGVYKSLDWGASWSPTSFNGFGAFDIGINANGIMFFANSTLSWSGTYRSSDLGTTWQNINPYFSSTALEYLNDGCVIAGFTETGVITNGIYVTSDNGNTWENTNYFTGNNLNFYDIELDRNNDIYLSFTSPVPNQNGIYLSTDNGYFWSNIGLPNDSPIICLAIDSSGYVYAGSNYYGIFRTPGRTVPVELFSFTAIANVNEVTLYWSTATETNNSGFEILRTNKDDSWNKIGFVPGHGTTTETQHYSFIDNDVSPGKFQYKLKQIDYDGTFEYSQIVEIEIPLVNKFSLSQNYPNPFNPSTVISYRLPVIGFVTLKVYDILGREIATLVNEEKPAGEYEVEFDGANLPSGIYFYQLKVGSFVETRNMVLIK